MRDPLDTQTADYIEDAEQGQPLDIEQALTDEALAAGGLKPVKAWVRTKQASNALRTQRYKERQAAEGVRQINVQAPQEAHEALREIAARTRAGEALGDVLQALAGVQTPPTVAAVERTLAAGGFRAWLIRRLLAGRS